ncbi:hypothetical protein [Amycolatopsis australiensis]|uniref:PknH-like extracellular domain-containing protein n=1 Tax=Amycolatopsis australiensis TaxID=546364 RepID=A0A1K1S0T3_9PSEU|nr:hypothetical protein [Amycolatopsis australiensis]SFW78032.1 hypothetical protein SAMN04489730_4427 [Amycolatopsis australiensis]
MKRFSVLFPVLGALLVLGTACSAPPAGDPGAAAALPEPAIPANPPPAPASAAEVHLPLDPYLGLAKGHRETLEKANAILITKCMRDKGFPYQPADGGGGGAAQQNAPLPDYGLNDLKAARESGYSPPGGGSIQVAAEQGRIPTLDKLVQDHGAAWVKALYGFLPPDTSGSDGCLSTAVVSAPEYDKLDKELPGRLAGQASERTQGDSRVVAALSAWSACMADSGFSYRSPAEPRRQKWPSPPSAAEIATAVADVNCKARTNLAGIWLAVQTGYQQTLVEQNAPALKQLQDAWQGVLKNAEQIVAAGG